VTIAIGYAHDGVKLIDEGFPLQISFPSEGTGYEVASISMIKNAPAGEQAAAQKLYDWALGQTAATAYAAHFVVPFVDVPLAKGAIPISQVNTITQDDQWAAKEKDRLVEKWNSVIGSEKIEVEKK